MASNQAIYSSATISKCGRYRYTLERQWSRGETCLFVGLNPSTADGMTDDATTRKCTALAQNWGFAGLTMVNLFALRCRYPQALSSSMDPVGQDNDSVLYDAISSAKTLVAMWGNHGLRRHGQAERRDGNVLSLAQHWQCIGLTKVGAPKHPLYASHAASLMPLCPAR